MGNRAAIGLVHSRGHTIIGPIEIAARCIAVISVDGDTESRLNLRGTCSQGDKARCQAGSVGGLGPGAVETM